MKEIKLTQGKVALVDDQDYDFLMRFKWSAAKARNRYYATTNIQCLDGRWTAIKMHQLILDRMLGYEENNLESDHKDREGLNNQRYNLRRVTPGLNRHNRSPYGKSKYRGVFGCGRSKKWEGRIIAKGKRYYLGRFDSEISAAKAYDRMSKKLYGSDAETNFE